MKNTNEKETKIERKKNPLSSFKYAEEGVLHSFRTQPHMRFHFYVLVVVLLSGLLLNFDNHEMLALLFSITLVIVAEMFNTVVEVIVDMITDGYRPAAKLAKDVAAGAVLVAAMNATLAGVLIFFGRQHLTDIQDQMHRNLPPDITKVAIIGVVSLALIVIISKLITNTGTPFQGGIISGHSAIGFLLAMTILFTANNPAIAFLAILLAVLVAQSRIEAGFHSLREVILGAVLAILLTGLVYRGLPLLKTFFPSKSPTTTKQTTLLPHATQRAEGSTRRVGGDPTLG
ncbi:diacylglycerol kinase [Armatimonadota bacterium]|nr:diacylglycerol kinase [Armatimonadota bacterium]